MAQPARRLSGLQKQALSLYRQVLRVAREKEGELRGPLAAYVRAEFDKHRGVDRKNYQLIEHLLRKGRKQLDVVQQADVKGLQLTLGQQRPAG